MVRVIGQALGMNATATLTQLTINIGRLIHPSKPGTPENTDLANKEHLQTHDNQNETEDFLV